MTLEVHDAFGDWKRARRNDIGPGHVAFVPTMGALHEGHADLIRTARQEAGRSGHVVVSIYVNPTQFNDAADFEARYGPVTGRSCWQEFAKKRLTDNSAAALNDRLAKSWKMIAEEIAEISIAAERLCDTMTRIGAPTTHEDLGLPAEFYRDAVVHAREIRDRFTFLDLAADMGMLEARFAP